MMIFLRAIGMVLALGGLLALLFGLVNASAAGDNSTTYALFALVGGLLLAMAADAGQRLAQKQKEQREKKAEKPKQG
jgi:hypothetical protein